jgi:hypothetical protein
VAEPVCDQTGNLWPQERVRSASRSSELVGRLHCSRQTHAQLGAHPRQNDIRHMQCPANGRRGRKAD